MPLLTDTAAAQVTCATCGRRTTIQPEHLPNVLAGGPWNCGTHPRN